MYFSNQAEAVIAIASVVLSADMVGSREEQHFLFTRVRGMEVFRGLDHKTFHETMVNVNEWLFGEDRISQIMTDEGVTRLCSAVKAIIPQRELAPTFRMACEMAHVDGIVPVEKEILRVIGTGLGISSDAINQAIGGTIPA